MMKTTKIDEMILSLQKHKNEWAALPITKKIGYLVQLQKNIDENAAHWVKEAVKAKEIIENTAGVGEEWISGPWAVLFYLNQLIETLKAVEKGQCRKLPSVRQRANGQVIARVFPLNLFDKLLLSGVVAEVWMQPGVTKENLEDTMALFYKQKAVHGKVMLVLGAGNVSSIPLLDVLYKLYAEGGVCILKMNPVNEYLGPIFEKIFNPFIQAGFVQLVYGGAEVGAYLTSHQGIEEIHITGSQVTHDVIVFGPGDEGEKCKEKNVPLLTKTITSELGGCCPTIVVPGPWNDADIQYHAEHIISQKYHNGGFNCVACQVLVLPEEWEQAAKLLDVVRRIFAETGRRKAYYPKAWDRQQSVVAAYPNAEVLDTPKNDVPRTIITGLDPMADNEICFQEEFFGGVLAQTGLPGSGANKFLENVVEFCNERLTGTLGANIIIHPKTIKELGPRFEDFLAELKYGTIAVNTWTGVAYLLSMCSWGAFPGHTREDIQSGIGVVHNSFLFDKPQKSVVYADFYPFPRAMLHGHFHLSPKPPWFVTNKRAHIVGRRLAKFEVKPGFSHIPGIFIDALRG